MENLLTFVLGCRLLTQALNEYDVPVEDAYEICRLVAESFMNSAYLQPTQPIMVSLQEYVDVMGANDLVLKYVAAVWLEKGL